MQIWIKEGKTNKYIVVGKYNSYICTMAGVFNINNARETIKKEGYKNILLSYRNINILDISKENNTYLFISPNRVEVVEYDKSIDVQIIL